MLPDPENAPTVSLRQAATALGIGRDLAYTLAARGEFPCPVLKLGRVYRVPTAALRKLLALDGNGAGPEQAGPASPTPDPVGGHIHGSVSHGRE